MKLGKEEIQKIVLGVLLLLGLLYAYFNVLLGPLKKQRARYQGRITELNTLMTEVRAQIRREQDLEAKLPVAADTEKQVKAMIPEGAPVAWFPPLVAEHFKREGLSKAAARMTSEQVDSVLPGFRQVSWTVDLAQVEFIAFAEALADFENNEPLAEIISLQMSAGSDDVSVQKAFLNLRTTLTQ